MTLIAYFRLDQQESGIRKNKMENHIGPITDALNEMEFGKLKQLDIQL